MAQPPANAQKYIIHEQWLLRPPTDRVMYVGLAIGREGEWKLELWIYFKSPENEQSILIHLAGIQDGDFATRIQTQRGVSYEVDTGFLASNNAYLNIFPVGIISPELQETFLTNDLRLQVIAGIAQKNWRALYWLRQHGVRISRQYMTAIGNMVWLTASLPAVPFETWNELGAAGALGSSILEKL
jgi:hypothetical protein